MNNSKIAIKVYPDILFTVNTPFELFTRPFELFTQFSKKVYLDTLLIFLSEQFKNFFKRERERNNFYKFFILIFILHIF